MSADAAYAFKAPALYNPRLWDAAEVRAYYVARPTLLKRLMDDLGREHPGSQPQHRLIIGLRGMGKSTLLRRIAVAVEDDAALSGQWLPLDFPEEQYNVAGLGDFWLNCLDALSDLLESRGRTAEAEALDAQIVRLDRKDGEGALAALREAATTLERRLLLLVDNVDLVFERIKADDWKLREALQAHPELLIVGASAKALESTYRYDGAFYDFFKIDELRGLSEAEMRETIVNLARLGSAQHIIARIDADPARLRVLHTLTGGNPRTAVLLYGVLLKGIDGDVRSDLEGLLDEVTPLYKARFEELPTQSQQLLDKLALHWHPASAAMLAEALGWKVNLVSAQLDRLINAGIVERVKVAKRKRLHFQIGERFFNIWYLMRTSRRLRRRLVWLVECLRGLYDGEELQAMARQRMALHAGDLRHVETLVALSDALDDETFKRALTERALELLLESGNDQAIHELFEPGGGEAHYTRYKDRYTLAHRFKDAIDALTVGDPQRMQLETVVFTAKDIEEIEKARANEKPAIAGDEIRGILTAASERTIGKYGDRAARLLASSTGNGLLCSLKDVDGMSALALRYDAPYLAALAQCKKAFAEVGSIGGAAAYARLLTEYDPVGWEPWFILAVSTAFAGGPSTTVKDAAHAVIALESSPLAIAVICCACLMPGGAPVPLDAFKTTLSKVRLDNSSDQAELKVLFRLAIRSNWSETLLEAWDKTFPNSDTHPFRAALDAAVHEDAARLDQLAPEVANPAREVLAAIAPKLVATSAP